MGDGISICGVLYALVGLGASCALIPFIHRRLARNGNGATDRQFHQTHKTSVPRFGGLALSVAFVLVIGVAVSLMDYGPLKRNDWIIVLSSLAMFGLGFWDDLRPLGAKVKLAGQFLVASGVYFCGIQIKGFSDPFGDVALPLGSVSFFATVFWLVAMTNLINLIDGIDGLAGGIAFMLMCLLAYVGWGSQSLCFVVAAGMAGALLGFIYFNFPPARIYLGDGGAYFLGFLIGVLSIVNSQKGTIAAALIAPLFALALPIVDTTLAIVRRGLRGLPLFRADRKHIHHRLVQAGFSHRRTVLTLYALSLVFSVMAFGVFWSQGRLVPILFGLVFLTLIVSARSVGFARGWFAVGSVLGTTMQMRKESRYALCLSRWLELEAERCKSLEALWGNFVFLVRKLGFAKVTLYLDGGQKVWFCPKVLNGAPAHHHDRQEVRLGNVTGIEFSADCSRMSPKLFEHLCELAAEAWTKAGLRWQTVNGQPINLTAESAASVSRRRESARAVPLPA